MAFMDKLKGLFGRSKDKATAAADKKDNGDTAGKGGATTS